MIEAMLSAIRTQFPLTEMSCGQYHTMKVKGTKFVIRRFKAEGLGTVSTMVASGFLGLMKMSTLIINPTAVDMPLLSYDRVQAMGNDTLIFELYDTLLDQQELSNLAAAKLTGKYLPDHALGSHWYDPLKLPLSLSKKGRKEHISALNQLATTYLDGYLLDAKNAPDCDELPKKEKASVYVEGLLEHGGPSTDVFMKGIGAEKTADLFRRILFATNM
jgi:hypothetical protein